MKLPNNCIYSSKEISSYPSDVSTNTKSILEKLVNASNIDFIEKTKHHNSTPTILEVGCGNKSFIMDKAHRNYHWIGMDINQKSIISNLIGSVGSIPFRKNTFDYVISNQSIEHWYEYGVSFDHAFNEIYSVLKVGGQAYLNFPLYLHGHPIFVTGGVDKLLDKINKQHWKIIDLSVYYDKRHPNYKGWRLCGFPDSYIEKHQSIPSSLVGNLILQKISDMPVSRKNKQTKKLNIFKKNLNYGLFVFLWKLYRKVIYGRTRWEKK